MDLLRCNICRSDLLGPRPRDPQAKASSTSFKVSDLEISHKTGCGFCEILIKAIRFGFLDEQEREHLEEEFFLIFHPIQGGGICLRLHSHREEPYDGLDIYLSRGNRLFGRTPGVPAPLQLVRNFPHGLGEVKEVPESPQSPRTWAFIASHLDLCISSHIACCRGAPSNESTSISLPSRLLQIDSHKAGSQIKVRLVDTDPSAAAAVKYAALSYSWGFTATRPPLTTTRSNLAQMRAGIDTSEMPLTLQDAITVCLRLDVSSIWIDSLCIIQDDAQDWADESRRMGTIYQNAFFTIVSASTQSCHDSFLNSRRGGSLAIARVRVGAGADTDIEMEHERHIVKVRRRINSGHHLRCHEVYPNSPIDPIDKRAWTLQERALSTRSIVFTGKEVQWECGASKACECDLGPVEDTIREFIRDSFDLADRKTTVWPLRDMRQVVVRDDTTPSKSLPGWEILVTEYSRRALTVDADRLPALSALASSVSPYFDDSAYFAGLWSKELLSGLCWSAWHDFTGAPSDKSRFAKQYVAPSFSWASVIGQVTYANERVVTVGSLRWRASVAACHIRHGTHDVFGRVLSESYIDLRAPLSVVSLVKMGNNSSRKTLEVKFHSIPDPPSFLARVDGPIYRSSYEVSDTRLDGTTKSSKTELITLRRFTHGHIEDYYRNGHHDDFFDVPIHFVPLFENNRTAWDRTTIWGLLLGRRLSAEPEAANEYERIGRLSLDVRTSKFDFGRLYEQETVVRIY
ncbi:heterokaryon incompatibility protein-domain-containing protein, partial [Rhypophila decipiens]